MKLSYGLIVFENTDLTSVINQVFLNTEILSPFFIDSWVTNLFQREIKSLVPILLTRR